MRQAQPYRIIAERSSDTLLACRLVCDPAKSKCGVKKRLLSHALVLIALGPRSLDKSEVQPCFPFAKPQDQVEQTGKNRS